MALPGVCGCGSGCWGVGVGVGVGVCACFLISKCDILNHLWNARKQACHNEDGEEWNIHFNNNLHTCVL